MHCTGTAEETLLAFPPEESNLLETCNRCALRRTRTRRSKKGANIATDGDNHIQYRTVLYEI